MMTWMILTVMTAVTGVIVVGALMQRAGAHSVFERQSLIAHDLAVMTLCGMVVSGSASRYAVNAHPALQEASATENVAPAAFAGGPLLAQMNSDGQVPGDTSGGLATVDEVIGRLTWRPQLEASDAEGWQMPGRGRFSTKQASAAFDESKAPDLWDHRAPFSSTLADRPSAIIRDMVEGLAGRLANARDDADGWIKLVQSYKDLGEDQAARAALRRALEVFADSAPEQGLIADAAHALGIYQ